MAVGKRSQVANNSFKLCWRGLDCGRKVNQVAHKILNKREQQRQVDPSVKSSGSNGTHPKFKIRLVTDDRFKIDGKYYRLFQLNSSLSVGLVLPLAVPGFFL